MPNTKKKLSNKINLVNRKASFSYQILDKHIAGMMLTGSEIKSVRTGQANLKEGYCYFLDNTLWIKGIHISIYKPATYHNHAPTRARKLLLKKRELARLKRKKQEKGITIVPLRLFITEKGWAKLEIALAKGKKNYDKRASAKEKDLQRSLRDHQHIP